MSHSVQDSLVEMTEIVLPEDTNSHGSIFGGRVLSLVDKCAAIVAMRHARSAVLTASVDSVAFLTSMNVGNIIVLKGRLNAVFGSSMEAEVQVFSENALLMPSSRPVRLSAVPNAGAPFSIGVAAWAASGGRPNVRLRLAAEPSAARRPRFRSGRASAAIAAHEIICKEIIPGCH